MKLSNKLYTKYITKFVELTTNNEKTELPETKVFFVDYDSFMDNFGKSMEVQTLLNDISNELTKKFKNSNVIMVTSNNVVKVSKDFENKSFYSYKPQSEPKSNIISDSVLITVDNPKLSYNNSRVKIFLEKIKKLQTTGNSSPSAIIIKNIIGLRYLKHLLMNEKDKLNDINKRKRKITKVIEKNSSDIKSTFSSNNTTTIGKLNIENYLILFLNQTELNSINESLRFNIPKYISNSNEDMYNKPPEQVGESTPKNMPSSIELYNKLPNSNAEENFYSATNQSSNA